MLFRLFFLINWIIDIQALKVLVNSEKHMETLFPENRVYPPGFLYFPDFLSEHEEKELYNPFPCCDALLLAIFRLLPFI
jgi:hypothetical protein